MECLPQGAFPEKSQKSFSQPFPRNSSADCALLLLLGPCHCSAALWQAGHPSVLVMDSVALFQCVSQ